MSHNWSDRYGDLKKIAHQTDCRCHLCHEEVDLDCYGPTGVCGAETINIDHLTPQSWGGDDDPENLRIAHSWCNSYRGVRDPEEVRWELAGTEEEPHSRGAAVGAATLGGAGVALVAGELLATTDEYGRRRFNGGAAAVAGILAFLLVR